MMLAPAVIMIPILLEIYFDSYLLSYWHLVPAPAVIMISIPFEASVDSYLLSCWYMVYYLSVGKFETYSISCLPYWDIIRDPASVIEQILLKICLGSNFDNALLLMLISILWLTSTYCFNFYFISSMTYVFYFVNHGRCV